ncbi:nicotinamidase-related amidase [Rhodanobacter sp. ANJX3]|uniref:isochorismatase family protein n=1 Tax=Rhodanobacter sp. ANJX3 TaxID=2723083 RepID=UPI00160BA22F|nr:isochorismatase family protein [Rhodanobacter sp. ANJX3]MBB5359075.1 nicotinamidase-related amidase [Rhodanobacter sp. ANJX3]
MPLTTLDKHTALIVIDLQKGIVGLPTAHPIDDVIGNAGRLIEAFRRHDLPVVLVNVTGVSPGRVEQSRLRGEFPAGWADLIPQLNPQPQDHLVTKQTRSAFTGTDLDAYLKQRGVTQVVVVGVATSSGVESTARHAYENGFNVTLAVDAMTDMSLDHHTHSITQIFPRIAETGTTQDVIDRLERSA